MLMLTRRTCGCSVQALPCSGKQLGLFGPGSYCHSRGSPRDCFTKPLLHTPIAAGAELAGLCREAALAALREDFSGAQQVAARHFDAARDTVRPSLTPELLQKYESWSRTSARGTQARGGRPGG